MSGGSEMDVTRTSFFQSELYIEYNQIIRIAVSS
jgi:hypothetical protein